MDEAERWLRENDPEYKKKEKLEYAYFSEELMKKKRRREIPVSSVYNGEVQGLMDMPLNWGEARAGNNY